MGKETKKLKIDFDTIPLHELKDTINSNLIDISERRKYKRTTKSKRENKQLINFFGSLAYYLNNLSQNETNDDTN